MAAHIVVEGSQASAAGLADCLFSVVPDGFQIRREYRPGRVEWPGRPEGPVSPLPLFEKDPALCVQLRQSGKEVSGRRKAASQIPGRRRAITRRQSGGLHGIEQFFQFRSEEHTSELQSLMRISYAVFCLKKKTMT